MVFVNIYDFSNDFTLGGFVKDISTTFIVLV